jgi:hypothetical protein
MARIPATISQASGLVASGIRLCHREWVSILKVGDNFSKPPKPVIKADIPKRRLIGCQFTALREFTLNGTDHASHREQGGTIRRYIAWRNRHTRDPRLRRIVKRANVV